MAARGTRTGRAVSVAIVDRLRASLASGRALSIDELAAEARCTDRTVRNYLRDAEATLGLELVGERGPDRRVRYRLADRSSGVTMQELGRALAAELLRRVFPVAGTDLERRRRGGGAQLVVAVRGAFEYDELHLRALRTWLSAANATPRRQVRFHYVRPQEAAATREAWPLGIVVRDLARVYLVGVPAEAEDARDVRTWALERVGVERGRASLRVVSTDGGRPAPRGLDSARVEEAIDLPFSVFPARPGSSVQVHVRFEAAQAPYVRGRRWHRRQHERVLRDGRLDLRFGPADLGEAAAWVRQWGSSVQVLGDRALVRALGKQRA